MQTSNEVILIAEQLGIDQERVATMIKNGFNVDGFLNGSHQPFVASIPPISDIDAG